MRDSKLQKAAEIAAVPQLHRALGTLDLVLLNIAAIVGLRWLERAKWLENLGGMATWLIGALVLCGGALAWYKFGAATPISVSAVVPNLKSSATLASFSTIALAFVGLELGPIMGGEIKDPGRSIGRALLW
jgi:glutamate:GABA antiporter